MQDGYVPLTMRCGQCEQRKLLLLECREIIRDAQRRARSSPELTKKLNDISFLFEKEAFEIERYIQHMRRSFHEVSFYFGDGDWWRWGTAFAVTLITFIII